MKQLLIFLFGLTLLSCSNENQPKDEDKAKGKEYFEITDFAPEDTLFRAPMEDYEMDENFCYVNQNGDTIIPYGMFDASFTDTIITYGIVVESSADTSDLIGINQQGQRLYEVQWFDNGPDYVEDGMFRISRNGLIGFADTTGRIVIAPKYKCAYPFSYGQAKVALNCELEKDGDNTLMESDEWFLINKSGQKVD